MRVDRANVRDAAVALKRCGHWQSETTSSLTGLKEEEG